MEKLLAMTEQELIKKDITLLYGIAEKSIFSMTAEERKAAASIALQRAKEAAFTRGLPIIILEKGKVIAEYANGNRFVRVNGKDIEPWYG
ncbi:MAG: hypothetical protein MUC59_06330 [Saprospiraceae bacterium]|nr:hypothetical protein [Saprospiraceae bacterium]